jgi:4-amino-4-deoxy-L-arabinose transferase-like glycosyltransferase
MSVLAAIRPDDWNFPLLMHVFGAMLLVGGLVTAVTALLLGWRRDSPFYSRIGFWALLAVAFPAWWIMRIGAQWIYSKENFNEDDEPGWLGVGYLTADLGGLLLLLTIILTGVGAWRLRRSGSETSVLTRIGGVLACLVLIAYTVAVWAMTAKPD